jgi:PUA-domain protein
MLSISKCRLIIDEILPAKRHLKDKEVRLLLKEFEEKFPSYAAAVESAKIVEELPVEESLMIFLDGKPLILRTTAGLLPTLKFEALVNSLPKIVVDMGAVPHVVNGAQIMRPGIKHVKDDFRKGDLLVIVEEKYNKPIALGIAEMDSGEMRSQTKGRVITNLHYVGDELWKSFTT